MPQSLRATFLAFVLALLSGACAGQTRDGRTWQNLSENEKFVYVAGFFDGNFYATLTVMEAAAKAQKNARLEELPPTTLAFTKAIDEKLKNMSPRQLVDGMNKTYSDYRNERVSLMEAMFAVVQSIKGNSDAEINRYLEQARKRVSE